MATNIVSYNWTTQFERAFKAPLDKQGFFESLSKAEEYLSKYADINVYDGQLMSIGTGEEASLYIVKSRYRAVGPATHFWDSAKGEYRTNVEGETNTLTHVLIGDKYELVEGIAPATHFWDSAKGEYRENAAGESNALTHDLHYFLEEAGGAIKSFSTADEITGFAVSKNIGKIFYVNGNIMSGGEVLYSAGPYVVTGDNSVMKLATSTASGNGNLDTEINNLKTSINERFESLSNALHFLGNAANEENDPKIVDEDVFYQETITKTTTTVGTTVTSNTDNNITKDLSYEISGKTYGGDEGTPLENGDLVIQGKKEFVVVVSVSEPKSTSVTEDQTTTTTEVTTITKTWSLLGDVTGVQDLLTWQEED